MGNPVQRRENQWQHQPAISQPPASWYQDHGSKPWFHEKISRCQWQGWYSRICMSPGYKGHLRFGKWLEYKVFNINFSKISQTKFQLTSFYIANFSELLVISCSLSRLIPNFYSFSKLRAATMPKTCEVLSPQGGPRSEPGTLSSGTQVMNVFGKP